MEVVAEMNIAAQNIYHVSHLKSKSGLVNDKENLQRFVDTFSLEKLLTTISKGDNAAEKRNKGNIVRGLPPIASDTKSNPTT